MSAVAVNTLERLLAPVPALHAPDPAQPPSETDEAYRELISERWRRARAPRSLSSRQLDAFYRIRRLIPRRLQLAARRRLIRWQGLPDFPAWPLDDSVGRLLLEWARSALVDRGLSELEFRWFWPEGAHAALVLSHDVESEAGLRGALAVADLEQELGLRSSFNVVAEWYPIDRGVLRELRSRGFEVGLHGLRHDRSMFATRAGFEQQLPRARRAAAELGAEGFRSPATHRVFEWLAELPVAYDCTMPHSDPFEPQPGGSCSLWPFFIGALVELPYTLPQDHTTFTLLGHRDPALWLAQAERIRRRFGLIQCVSHPDPGYLGDPAQLRIYRSFLEQLHERERIWAALPRDVARWWRARDSGAADPRLRLGRVRLRSESGLEILAPDGTAGAMTP